MDVHFFRLEGACRLFISVFLLFFSSVPIGVMPITTIHIELRYLSLWTRDCRHDAGKFFLSWQPTANIMKYK